VTCIFCQLTVTRHRNRAVYFSQPRASTSTTYNGILSNVTPNRTTHFSRYRSTLTASEDKEPTGSVRDSTLARGGHDANCPHERSVEVASVGRLLSAATWRIFLHLRFRSPAPPAHSHYCSSATDVRRVAKNSSSRTKFLTVRQLTQCTIFNVSCKSKPKSHSSYDF
jgi:hypothetical protein